jgi:hypothetical protein
MKRVSHLTPAEETFLHALLWEEGHLRKGPATQAAEEHGLSLIRCLEPANRLSPNLEGASLNQVRDSACSTAEWPWDALNGDQVLRLLWSRLAENLASERTQVTSKPVANPFLPSADSRLGN